MSSNSVRDLRDTIVPKSDQLNAEQLLGGPIVITVTDVRRGGGEDQPVVIHYEGEGGRPYKPCKSMRKVLVFAWGPDGSEWIGRSMTLFNRPDVKFGGEAVGGIRISHLSDIPKEIAISLTATRGKKEATRIGVLRDVVSLSGSTARLEAAARDGMSDLQEAWKSLPAAHKREIGGAQGCPDDLKRIAQEADARSTGNSAPSDGTPPVTSVDAVLDAIDRAEDQDALDVAYDMKGLVTDLAQDDRERITAAYEQRRDSLQN